MSKWNNDPLVLAACNDCLTFVTRRLNALADASRERDGNFTAGQAMNFVHNIAGVILAETVDHMAKHKGIPREALMGLMIFKLAEDQDRLFEMVDTATTLSPN